MILRILLVDDEPLALQRLRDLMEGLPGLEVAGEALDGLQALEAIQSLHPDLVLLDIQMPGLDGFGVLEALAPEERPLVVFCTAFDRHAVRAFEAHALDYLLKPVRKPRLQQTLARATAMLELQRGADARSRLESLLKSTPVRRREVIVTRCDGRFRLVRLEDVEAIEAESNYMWVHRGRKADPVRATLQQLEAGLDPSRFLRVHRSWILNLDWLLEVEQGPRGGLIARTRNDLKVPVSSTYRAGLEARLAFLAGG